MEAGSARSYRSWEQVARVERVGPGGRLGWLGRRVRKWCPVGVDRRNGVVVWGWRMRSSEGFQGAADASAAGGVEDVGVDHGGLEVGVAEELLDGADVVAILEGVSGKAVTGAGASGEVGAV